MSIVNKSSTVYLAKKYYTHRIYSIYLARKKKEEKNRKKIRKKKDNFLFGLLNLIFDGKKEQQPNQLREASLWLTAN
jgi:hypothetical protein